MKRLFLASIFLSTSVAWSHRGHDHSRHIVERVVKAAVAEEADSCPTAVPDNLDQESQLLADKKWFAGAPDCSKPESKLPPYEVHQVNDGYYVMRQNKCVNFEAPFVYLYIGDDSAFLFDTGASYDENEFPIRKWVDEVLKKHPKGDKLKLVVAHSHSHGDHVAGDSQFRDRPNTTVVGQHPSEVARAFNIKKWPTDIGSIDLGNRKLSIIPIPGHESSSIAVYDHKSKDMLTGDTIYPGNIFLSEYNWPEFSDSIKRLHKFSKANTVRNILGAHIEMSSKPKVDYEYGSNYHPEEHRLPLYQKHLDELNEFVNKNRQAKGKVFDDLIIPLP
jgi:hydroxyacylglutathione hydrolase